MLLALCAGGVLGVAARVAMRIIAWQAGVNAAFSLGGSVEVILLGVLVGAPGALLYWACRRRFTLPAWAGIVAALLLFGVFAAWPTPSARSALVATPDAPAATAVVLAMVFVVYGAALEALWRVRPSS
jgi:hypothetical protein